MKEARFYEKLEEDRVRCLLCPHHCKISPGRTGICRVRQNAGGVLCTLNYGQVTSWAVDPIEKKPLYHFYPGSQIFSVGTFGCNFHCGFCQNWQIAHKTPPTEKILPEELVKIAVDAGKRAGSIGIAYTYSEPNVWFEFVYDVAKLAHEHGLKNVLVTNGFIEEEPLQELLPFIDAMNIDVKAFSERFYKEVCHGQLAPVLRTVEIAHQQCHVEITNLIVPTENDREEEIEGLVEWIASIDRAIPLHFSRYFPQYKFTLPPTPLETLKKAREIALRRLQFVYIGNAWELGENDTFCPVCGNLLIKRSGYKTRITGLEEHRCSKCGAAIPVVV